SPIFNKSTEDSDPNVWKGNQAAIIKSPLVISAALSSDKVKNLGVSGESADALEKALKVDFLLGPEIVRISLSGDQADGVAPVVNAVVEAYLKEMELQENNRRLALLRQLEESKKGFDNELFHKRSDLTGQEKLHRIDDKQTLEFKYKAAMDRLAGEAR